MRAFSIQNIAIVSRFSTIWGTKRSVMEQKASNVVNTGFASHVEKTSMDTVADLESPRYIKSHLPWNLLPKEIRSYKKRPKIIYVARDPRDVAVSVYHHKVLFSGYLGTLDEFMEEFVADWGKLRIYQNTVHTSRAF